MISFSCPSCARAFSVPDHLEGRSARCKGCGRTLSIPRAGQSVAGLQTPVAPSAPSPRLRRLIADQEQMQLAFAQSDLIHIESTQGNPPELYHVRFAVAGLERGEKKKPVKRETHRIEVQLTLDYPRVPPLCRMLTPVFHPNIDAAHICIGDHWTAGERLPDLVIRIGELIAYQAYNIRSPLDAQAAMWTDLHTTELPIDPRPLRPPGW